MYARLVDQSFENSKSFPCFFEPVAGANLPKTAFSPDGSIVVTSGTKQIIVYNADDLSTLKALDVPNSASALAFSPDSRILACGTYQEVKLWSIPSFSELDPIKHHQEWVTGLAFSTDGHVIVSGSKELSVTLLSVI